MSTIERWAAGGLAVLVTGCAPPRVGPIDATLPWWLVVAIMGGSLIYAAIRSKK